jgi:hypothetical protein
MITQITLRNLKGVNATYDLTGKDILSGSNGAGKSAVLEGLQLALTGYTAQGKKPTATMALSSEDVVEVSITDGTNFLSRKFELAKASATQTITLNGKVVKESELEQVLPESFRVPIEAIHPAEFLALSGDKRAAWLFGNLGGLVQKIAPDQIPAKLKTFAAPLPADEVLALLADEQKTNKAEIERCKANLQRLMGSANDLPKGTLSAWEETLKNCEKDLEAVTAEKAKNEERTNLALSRHQHRRRLEDGIKQAEDKVNVAKLKIKSLAPAPGNDDLKIETLPTISAELTTKTDLRRNLESVIKSSRDKIAAFRAHGSCPTCGTTAEILDGVIEELDLTATGAEMDLEAVNDEIAALSRSIEVLLAEKNIREANHAKELERKVLEDALKSYLKFLAREQEALEKFNSEEQSEPVSSEILDAKIAGLKNTRESIKETIKKFTGAAAIKTARADAEAERQRLERSQEEIKESIGICKHVRDSALEEITGKIAAPFTAAANIAFQADPFFRILNDKGKPEVDFGIVRNGREISFDTLSGGERLVILVALVASLQIAKVGAPKLAMIEMAEADSVRFKSVTEACSSIGFEQVILASCNAVPVEGWNVIAVGQA